MRFINYFFNLAKQATISSNNMARIRRYKLGAVALRNDGTIVSSRNLNATHQNLEVHAERRLSRKLDKGAIVFVVRIKSDGYGNAHPCPGCLQTLKLHKVKRVYYSINNNEFGTIVFKYK